MTTDAVPCLPPGVTHLVTNQVPPLVGHEGAADPVLLAALHREGAGWYEPDLHDLGRRAGGEQAQRWAVEANTHEPVLHTHDRYGHRLDEVEYHPAYHHLMGVAIGAGLGAAPWLDDRPAAHVARAAGMLVWSQVEQGHICPVTMTYAVVPALRAAPDLAATYLPLLASRTYDPGLRVPTTKSGLLAGMSMTEKQGGSDVRANTTAAVPHPDGTYRLTGHKWFTSAPMNDLFLVLAQAPEGLTCFLVPRVLPDGTRNTVRLQRLKSKLGNRSNASSEPEFDDTVAWPVGPLGRGVRTIIEMVGVTRMDCLLGSAAGLRAALVQAVHHARHREAFGARLIDQPLMRNVLADLALESEAATTLAMHVAGAFDRAQHGDPQARSFARVATAIGKYWVCKRQPMMVAEALECLGGNGYDEAFPLARLYREAPLNSVWEGAGNVNALDLLRILTREPNCLTPYFAEITPSLGHDPTLDQAVTTLHHTLDAAGAACETDLQFGARRLVEQLALVLQAALLVRFSPSAVAEAFSAARLGPARGAAPGTLPSARGVEEILHRVGV